MSELTPPRGSLIISSTEPPSFRSLLFSQSPFLTNISSTLPELHGADLILIDSTTHSNKTKSVRLGIQRKTYPDLLASLFDNRLTTQLHQLTSSTLLTHYLLIIEGPEPTFTDSGALLDSRRIWTRNQHWSTLAAIQSICPILYTDSPTSTLLCALSQLSYHLKPGHTFLHTRRGGGKSPWGTYSNRDWAIHFLQSFPSIGPTTAALIYDTFGIPLEWRVTARDLSSLPGIGPLTAQKLIATLQPRITPD